MGVYGKRGWGGVVCYLYLVGRDPVKYPTTHGTTSPPPRKNHPAQNVTSAKAEKYCSRSTKRDSSSDLILFVALIGPGWDNAKFNLVSRMHQLPPHETVNFWKKAVILGLILCSSTKASSIMLFILSVLDLKKKLGNKQSKSKDSNLWGLCTRPSAAPQASPSFKLVTEGGAVLRSWLTTVFCKQNYTEYEMLFIVQSKMFQPKNKWPLASSKSLRKSLNKGF